jgi:hypothetical protein
MSLAFLRNSVVVLIGPDGYTPPQGFAFDASRDGTGAAIGDTWNGSAYVPRPLPPAEVNRSTVETDLATDLANMQTIIGGPATMTTAQLTSAVKALARCNRRLIRIALARFDGAD